MGRDAHVGARPLGTEPQALLGLGCVEKTHADHITLAYSQDSVLGFLRTH